MKLIGSVPVLVCNKIDATLHFYQDAFQYVIVNKRKSEQGLEWVYLKSGDTLIMLEKNQILSDKDRSHAEAVGCRLYFYTDDADGTHHFLRARGYQLSDLRSTQYGMREFDITDPEGNHLTIGQKNTEN